MTIFQGYIRPDGSVGIRNYVLVLSIMDNVNGIAQKIAGQVYGAIALPVWYGRGQFGKDEALTRKTLIALGSHANVGATLIVGLEPVSTGQIAEAIRLTGKPVDQVVVQQYRGSAMAVAAGVEKLVDLAILASTDQRSPVSCSKLILGVECGATDTTSGLAANPLTGSVADRLCDLNGTVIMSETSEFMGAEHILARRARSPEVSARIRAIVQAIEDDARQRGVDIRGANPVPDNIAGGITTIEEKSLGAILKGGSHPIEQVLEFGDRPAGAGLHVMDTPAPAVESLTGLAAGGAQVTIFTTGQGNIVGSPFMPTIKISANRNTVRDMRINIDCDVSQVITGQEAPEVAVDRLFALLLAVCSGKMTKSEALGDVAIAIPRIQKTI